MKFILMLSMLFFPFVSGAQTQRYFEEVQALTRAVPSAPPSAVGSASRPLPLTGWTSYRLTVCPAAGYALTGTGSIRLYVYHPYVMSTGRWGYRKELDQSITITGNAVDICQTFGLRVDVRQGYLLPAAVGVGVTGGTTVTVRVDPDNF